MNTLKFLAVDHSLESGRNVVGRYRVRESGLLPRFEPGAAPAHASISWWCRLLARFRSRPLPLLSVPEERAMVELPADPPTAPSGDSVGGVARAPRFPPATLSSGAHPAIQAEAEGVPKPCQREFRFENVKVVCNDLHDADFEIVSTARRPRREADSLSGREAAVA